MPCRIVRSSGESLNCPSSVPCSSYGLPQLVHEPDDLVRMPDEVRGELRRDHEVGLEVEHPPAPARPRPSARSARSRHGSATISASWPRAPSSVDERVGEDLDAPAHEGRLGAADEDPHRPEAYAEYPQRVAEARQIDVPSATALVRELALVATIGRSARRRPHGDRDALRRRGAVDLDAFQRLAAASGRQRLRRARRRRHDRRGAHADRPRAARPRPRRGRGRRRPRHGRRRHRHEPTRALGGHDRAGARARAPTRASSWRRTTTSRRSAASSPTSRRSPARPTGRSSSTTSRPASWSTSSRRRSRAWRRSRTSRP